MFGVNTLIDDIIDSHFVVPSKIRKYPTENQFPTDAEHINSKIKQQ